MPSNTLLIDKEDERIRVEFEDGEMVEYYKYVRSKNKIYSLESSTIEFLQFIKPEDGKQKMSYKKKEEVLVFGIEVWKDVVKDCMTDARVTNNSIVEKVCQHEDTEKEKMEDVETATN